MEVIERSMDEAGAVHVPNIFGFNFQIIYKK
jgi:hypothetical protein